MFKLNKKNEEALSKLGLNTWAAINQWISQRINGSTNTYETINKNMENKSKEIDNERREVDNEIITILKAIDRKVDWLINADIWEVFDISEEEQEVIKESNEELIERVWFVLSERQQSLADTVISYIKENQMDDGSWDVGYYTKDFNVVMSYMGNRIGIGKIWWAVLYYIKENTQDLFKL